MRRRVAVFVLLVGVFTTSPAAQKPLLPQLYFVAIGEKPAPLLDYLVAHFQRTLGITIELLPRLAVAPLTRDRERSQLVADDLITAARRRYASLARDARTRLIAVTAEDIYMTEMKNQWRFTFSLRDHDDRFAVVSYARMNPANLGDPADEGLLRSRLRKMVMKNIGIMYYRLPLSENPRSVLYGRILGVDDLDRMTENFSPR
jgi:predicted Zn-dependent protease